MSLDEWKLHDLGSLIAKLESGSRPKGGADDESGELPSLGGENIRSDGRLDVSTVRKVPRSFFEAMSKGILRTEDVLINKDGANTGKVGIYRGEFAEAAINEHVFRLRGREGKLHQGFLFYFLASQIGQQHIRSRISGSAQPGLKSSFVDQLPIALPSNFDVQPTVATILESVDCAIEQTEALLAKQQRIKTGLMHDLLTHGLDAQGRLRNPATHRFKASVLGPIPEEWSVRSLADIVPTQRPIVYGILMPGAYVERGVPVIKVRDIQNGNIVTDGLLRTDPKIDVAFARSRLQTGDLLFTIRGSVGRMAVVPPELDRANITQDTARITVSEGNTSFIRHCLEMPSQQAVIELHTIGQAVKGINLGEVRKIPVQFPEPDEQEEIARRLDAYDRDLNMTKSHLGKLQCLKSGLMNDLLTGRVPVTPLLTNSKDPIPL